MSLHHAMRSAVNTLNADPDFENVSLLLLGNGTNGGQNNSFVDGSSNAFSITRYGNTTQGTFSPFGYNWGVNTGDGNYPTCSYTAFNSVSGDFTIECWAYVEDAGRSGDSSKYGNFFAGGATGSTSNIWAFTFLISGGVITQLILQTDNSDRISLTGLSISINTWHHFAMVRSGSTITIYVDGASVGNGTYSGTINSGSTGRTVIGQGSFGGSYANYLKGTISNVRFVVGTAVYTANFTPVTTNLTAITNTTLLTCQDNRFKDNSTNAFAISVTGSPSVTNFAPFPTNTEYSTGTNGGSGYFDGSGDYLEIAGNSAFAPGTGNFTVEGWVYLTSSVTTNYAVFSSVGNSSVANDGIYIGYDNYGTATLNGYIGNGTGSGNVAISTTSFALNAWTHIALTRSGTTLTLWVNGSSVGTATDTHNITATNTVLIGKAFTDLARYLPGYISNVRFLKGTAQYSSAFTPSTTPLTAITNTSLLLNFTSAAILDSTGKNNLETVGDAQISTSTKKYGTGSLKFDGTGDYLIIPNRSDHNFGTGDFTVECWFYIAGNASPAPDGSRHGTIVANMGASGIYTTPGFNLVILGDSSTTGTGIAFDNRVTTSTQYSVFGYTTISQNTWHHCAVVRSGTTTTIYLNGVSLASGTLTDQNISSTNPLSVGRLMAAGGWNFEFNGYIDDLRISKVCRYSSAFTPPSRQLPAR